MTDTLPDAADLAIDDATADLLFRDAHTAHAFTDEPVTDEQIQAVYELIKWGPTSLNTTPLRLTLVRSPQARERLVAHLSDGNKAKTAAAPLAAVVTADRQFHEQLGTLVPHLPTAKDFFAEPEGREQTAVFNAAIQLGYLIVGLRAAGLDAGPMTGLDAAGLEAELFPDGTQKVFAVVNIGRVSAEGRRPRAPRLPYEQVVTTI